MSYRPCLPARFHSCKSDQLTVGSFGKSKTAFHRTPQTISSACVPQLDTSNAQQSHEKEALQLAGCENRWWGGGGGRERERRGGSFMDILSRGKEAAGAATQQA